MCREQYQRGQCKRDKYADLRLRVKSLYLHTKLAMFKYVFDFLAAHSMNFAEELADILQDKKAVGVTIEKAQKWVIF